MPTVRRLQIQTTSPMLTRFAIVDIIMTLRRGCIISRADNYDPAVKRFINADDSNILLDDQGNILQYNLFAYCFDNPVNMYDEDGHYAASLTKRALSLGVTMSTLLLALKLLGLSNAWNVAGWVILGAVAAITVDVVGYKIYKSSKSKKQRKLQKKWKRKGE